LSRLAEHLVAPAWYTVKHSLSVQKENGPLKNTESHASS
jgi:hypothetical protein